MNFMLTLLLLTAHPIGGSANGNLTLLHDGEVIDQVSRTQFSQYPFGDSVIDHKKYLDFTDLIEKKVYESPVDARIGPSGKIIIEKNGHTLNRRKFKEIFYTNYYRKSDSDYEVPLRNVYPKVDSELLAHIRTKQIGHYVTYFNSYNKERTNNISLAAKAIDNSVVFPGETFSFNKVVGKRTTSRGYMKAPVIVRGELSEGIGGGICQVSSTLFNAVDRAGVRIVERYSHSRRVPYVPPHRDATVSWNGPDFTFENPHNQPILIRANMSGGQLVIVIYSSDSIDYQRRNVPNAPERLPIEIRNGE
ncbi:hypothetical protein D9X91_07430 [Falsibacillus albus]|uniref:Peptidoglycan binding domain-containing protein n=2 Tax=Falsibacillus albus TaxID=2478915 RepID=A0A3L7JZ78_9BACI|nr:hypothetical protein D9X91_07430 [Falsibacillus albus]